MRDDDYIGQKFHWFTGEVEDINDPDNLNRVRVRCHGYHPPAKKVNVIIDILTSGFKTIGVETKDLPWATVMMPVTSAGTPNVGANHHLEEGSWVFGFFRDGPSAQDPVVMGSMTTSTDGTKDLHSSASTTNKIYHSLAGHLIEIENKGRVEAVEPVEAVAGVAAVEASEGVEAVEAVEEVKEVKAVTQSGPVLRVTHSGGTKIEIDEDNNLTITVKEEVKEVKAVAGVDAVEASEGVEAVEAVEAVAGVAGVAGGNTTITTGGNTTIITQKGDTTIKTQDGDTTITSSGKTSVVSGDEITITSAVSTTIV